MTACACAAGQALGLANRFAFQPLKVRAIRTISEFRMSERIILEALDGVLLDVPVDGWEESSEPFFEPECTQCLQLSEPVHVVENGDILCSECYAFA